MNERRLLIKSFGLIGLTVMLLSGCNSHPVIDVQNNTNRSFQNNMNSPVTTNSNQNSTNSPVITNTDNQLVTTSEYKLTVPKDWNVKIDQGIILNFSKDGQRIGGLEAEGYIPPDSVSYPGHSLLIDKKKLDGFFTDVLQINFKRQPPAASKDTTQTKETWFYFLLKEKVPGHPDVNKAYVLYFDRANVSDQSMIDIANSLRVN